MKRQNTRVVIECGLMIALATVLSEIQIPWVRGGSITAASMLPLLLVAYRHGVRWGVATSFVHSLVQLGIGFQNVLFCRTLPTQLGCIALDYLVAFTLLGLAPGIGRGIGNMSLRLSVGMGTVMFGRFLCSFVSGGLIWAEYAPEGSSAWWFSLVYNAGYMVPEMLLTLTAALLLCRTAPGLLNAAPEKALP